MPIVIACCVLVFAFGGALLGMSVRSRLPEQHLNADSRDVVKLGIGLIATMSALVLSLLVASASRSYDAQRSQLTQMSVNIVLLDRALAHYGPDTAAVRAELRTNVAATIDLMWPADGGRSAQLDPASVHAEGLYDQIQSLGPQTDVQRSLQSTALRIALDVGRTRWSLFEQNSRSIPMPFLVVLVLWLTILFAGFGMLAAPNRTVAFILLLCALSVSTAVFLILELDQPFSGLIQVPSAPLRSALAQLGR
jgi:hypothetical protein